MTFVKRIAVLILITTASTLFAQNPFFDGGRTDEDRGLVQRSPLFARNLARTLQQNIGELSRRVSRGEWSAAFTAFLLAVLFGIVHIAGPGHGKVFAISYFSSRDAKLREGFLFSAVVNVVDSLSAFAIVMVGYVILRAVSPNFRTDGPRILELVSYSAIVLFGVFHLVSHARSHRHHETESRTDSSTTPWVLAASIGLVPCPVDTILLVYGIANNVLPFMLFMIVGVSLGGFLTMSLISAAVITGRTGIMAKLRTKAASAVSTVLELTASATIIAFGVIFFLGAL